MVNKKNKTDRNNVENIIDMEPIKKSQYISKLNIIIFISLILLSLTAIFVWYKYNNEPEIIKSTISKNNQTLRKQKLALSNEIKEIKDFTQKNKNELLSINEKIRNFDLNFQDDKISAFTKKLEKLDLKLNKIEKKVNNLILQQSKISDQSVKINSQTKTLDINFYSDFERAKKKLLNKKVFISSYKNNQEDMLFEITNYLSGFFKLRDYKNKKNPRYLVSLAEKSALAGNKNLTMYYLNKLPEEWKLEIQPILKKYDVKNYR